MLIPAPHRATTAQLQAAYPFVAESGLGTGGAYIGRDLLGGAFAYDPWELYQAGRITSPNAIIIGQIGRGKSALVKSYLWREMVFGRQAWVVDPKGEYFALAAACGVTPIRLVPGGQIRLNPLDPPGGAREAEPDHHRQSELLASLAAASLGRPLLPAERTAAELALTTVASNDRSGLPPTLPDVVGALLQPEPAAAAAVHTDLAALAADGRQVALELRRLVEGDLRGMFDGPTTPGLNLDAPLVVLDLSAVYTSAALGILMTCATAWLQAALASGDGIRRIVVVDEAWAVLSDVGIAKATPQARRASNGRSCDRCPHLLLHRRAGALARTRHQVESQELTVTFDPDCHGRAVSRPPKRGPSSLQRASSRRCAGTRVPGLSSAHGIQPVAHLEEGGALGEERPVDSHDPLPAALAHHPQPAKTYVHVGQAQRADLARAQAAQHHGQSDGTIPVRLEGGHERGHVSRLQRLGQTTRLAHEAPPARGRPGPR